MTVNVAEAWAKFCWHREEQRSPGRFQRECDIHAGVLKSANEFASRAEVKSSRKEQHKPKAKKKKNYIKGAGVQRLMMLPYALFMGGEKQEIGQTVKGLVCCAKEFGLREPAK